MTRYLLPLLVSATPVLADEGLHHHPHGVESGWIAAVIAGVLGGLVLARLWARK